MTKNLEDFYTDTVRQWIPPKCPTSFTNEVEVYEHMAVFKESYINHIKEALEGQVILEERKHYSDMIHVIDEIHIQGICTQIQGDTSSGSSYIGNGHFKNYNLLERLTSDQEAKRKKIQERIESKNSN